MVIGQYIGSIGSDRRVSFPKKFRKVLGDTVILTKGLDGNLIIVSGLSWETLLEGTEDKPFTDTRARELQAFLLGNASEIVLDGSGRFIVPEYLHRYAGLRREVIFVGLNRYVQLWDKKRWDEYQRQIKEHLDIDVKKLSESKD